MKLALKRLNHISYNTHFRCMSVILRYGADSAVQLNLTEGALVAHCGRPHAAALDAPGASVAQSLRQPLDYPPLAQSVTPADRVVLVLEPGLPQADVITAEVIRTLVDAGLDPDGLTVLRTAEDVGTASGDPCGLLPEDLRQHVIQSVHDPLNRQKLAYLATTSHGDSILLSRAITDADVVIPMGRFRNPASSGYYGVNGVVFPSFADQKTQLRFRALPTGQSPDSHRAKLIQECDEVGWLLGVTFALEVVPGPGDSLLGVLAGEIGVVASQGGRLYEDAWRASVPRRARLVVAAIEGGPAQQTWHNLGAALELAGELVEDGGAIAVCCDLAAQPGAGIQRLVGARSRQQAIREIRKQRPDDLLPATQLAHALDRSDVYLLSGLEESIVEDLEMAPITNPQELVRLTQRFPSCILVSNAANAMVSAEET